MLYFMSTRVKVSYERLILTKTYLAENSADHNRNTISLTLEPAITNPSAYAARFSNQCPMTTMDG